MADQERITSDQLLRFAAAYPEYKETVDKILKTSIKETATQAYERRYKEAQKVMGLIDKALKAHYRDAYRRSPTAIPNWNQVGDLAHVVDSYLKHALKFLTA